MRANAEKLDSMMQLMIQFISEACRCRGKPDSGRSHESPAMQQSPSATPLHVARSRSSIGDPAENLLNSLLSAFHVSLFPTYKCRCTQFLIFYGCSFDSAFTDAFINYLLSQVLSNEVHSEARIAGSAYIASFLARAKFVSVDNVLPPLCRMVTWARDYQRETLARLAGRPVVLDAHVHGVFYGMVQASLYLLCYKMKMLRQPEAAVGLAALSEQLQELLGSELNPLKFCHDAVVHEFAQLDLCDCSQIIAANECTAVGSRDRRGGENRLDDFFPFDPIQLKGTAEYINPLYQLWQPSPAQQDHPRDSNHSDSCSVARSDQTDGSASIARSLQAMSVTPADDLDSLVEKRFSEHGQLLQNVLSKGILRY